MKITVFPLQRRIKVYKTCGYVKEEMAQTGCQWPAQGPTALRSSRPCPGRKTTVPPPCKPASLEVACSHALARAAATLQIIMEPERRSVFMFWQKVGQPQRFIIGTAVMLGKLFTGPQDELFLLSAAWVPTYRMVGGGLTSTPLLTHSPPPGHGDSDGKGLLLSSPITATANGTCIISS